MPGEPRSPARNPVLVKIPVPIMLEITSAVALTTPNWRRRAGLAGAMSMSILRPVALLIFFSAAARARIVAADFLWLRGLGRLRRGLMFVLFFPALKHRREAMQPQALIEREHHQLSFTR